MSNEHFEHDPRTVECSCGFRKSTFVVLDITDPVHPFVENIHGREIWSDATQARQARNLLARYSPEFTFAIAEIVESNA